MDQATTYALLAADAYWDVRPFDENKAPIPSGWRALSEFDVSHSGSNATFGGNGFSGQVFQGPAGEIVISYAGTEFGGSKAGAITDFLSGNVPLAIGKFGEQAYEAALLYQRVQARFGANISFTGHSLGGGLAGLMAVWFDRPAIVFDPAPFEASADSLVGYKAIAGVRDRLAALGFHDPLFDTYSYSRDFATREARVQSYAVAGEVLESIPSSIQRIEASRTPYLVGASPDLAGTDKHSIDLLAAVMLKPEFEVAAKAVTALLPLMFDASLYGAPPLGTERNLLVSLVRNEVGINESGAPVVAPNGALGKFSADIQRLSAADGMTANSGIQKGLIVAAMEYYYFKDPASITALFSTSGNGVHFKYSDIGVSASGLKSPGRLSNAVWSLTEEAGIVAQTQARDAQAWHVQTGDAAMTWTDNDSLDDAALGGNVADALNGGSGNDVLIGLGGADTIRGGGGIDVLVGGVGNDTLDGGANSDKLYGGAGTDTYDFTGSFAADWIFDSGGNGQIVVDGTPVGSVGSKKVAEGAYTDGTWLYSLAPNGQGGNNLQLRRDGSLNSITVRDWVNGQLGITLNETPVDPVPASSTVTGDYIKKLDPNDPERYVFEAGNYANDGAQASADDVLNGTTGADELRGLGGNDALDGWSDDDLVEGGDGDDLLFGGLGADTLNGGAGRDFIYGSGIGALTFPDETTDEPPAAQGPEYTRGFSWVTYDAGIDADGIHTYAVVGAYAATANGDAGNVIDGGEGDDWIRAGSGADIVHGGADADNVVGLAGNDVLFGDDGDDEVWGDGIAVAGYLETVPGEQHGNDVLVGGLGNDTMSGQGGADEVYGGVGDDQLYGDDSDDRFTPVTNHGSDYLDGGDGNDTLVGGGKDDEIFGGTGNDRLWGDAVPSSEDVVGDDYLDGEEGDDQLVAGDGSDVLFGGSGKDTLFGEAGDDYLDGEEGDDQLLGGDGVDDLYAGSGKDTLFGEAGDDYLDGEEDDDALIGGDGNDQLFGGAGDDDLLGDEDGSGAGADYLDGEDGNDGLLGNGGDDTLVGGLDQDTLLGGDGNDQLFGDDGNDQLAGDSGNDLLEGGDGNDVIRGDDGDDVGYGDGGADMLFGLAGADVLDGGNGNDVVQGGDGGDVLYGGAGSDFVVGELGDDMLDGGGGNDEVQGNEGNDTVGGGSGNDVVFGLAGNDVVSGDDGDDYVDGGDGADSLNGGTGNDRLLGGAGNDTLDGGEGDDLLSGDVGVDTYVFGRGSGHDVIENYDPSYGTADVLRLSADVGADVVLAQRRGNDLVLTIADTGDSITISNQFLATRSVYNSYYGTYTYYYDFQLGSIQFADGTSWSGDSIPMYYSSVTGSGALNGTSYADVFGGSGGSSTYSGGSGSDTYNSGLRAGRVVVSDFGSPSDVDVLTLASEISVSDVKLVRVGTDLVLHFQDSPDQITVSGYFSSYGIDRIAFQSDGTVWDRAAIAQQFLLATDQDDQLLGTAGDDVIDGGAGNDTLMGGACNDSYLFGQGSGRDIITGEDSASGASDAVLMKTGVAPVDVALSRDGEDLLLSINTSSDGLRISGYFHDDGAGTVVGGVEQIRFSDNTVWDSTLIRSKLAPPTDGAEAIYGYETNDALNGLGGNDTIYGGRGDDTLDGGAGSDSLQGGSGKNTYVFGIGSGLDTVDALDDLNTPMENTVRLGAGFTPQQIATSRRGDDLILFMPGSTDQLTIRREYYTGDYQRYGIDQIVFDDGTVWDQNVVWSLGFSGTLRGTQDADSIVGTSGADLMYGYGGNDTLDGGSGSDTLTGGTGDDSYLVDSASDAVVENTSEGTDTVLSSVTYTLPTNVENLTSTGFSAINGTGNALDNVLTGNYLGNTLTGLAGNDTLNGADGVDALIGGTGNDTYILDGTADVVTENANEGTDTVRSTATYTLTANVENLVLIGSTAINGTGNALANVLTGNAANNVLDGGTGADTLQGGTGDDSYLVDNAGDAIVEAANEGSDTVQSSLSYTLAANVENLTLTGTAAINATGNGLNNVLAGNSANNVLTGGLGNDTYAISSGDTIVENAGEGVDTVSADFTYNTLGATLENLTLTGTGRINGGGNAQANALTGNAGTNLLTGYGGNDTLDGGAGKDTLVGGLGDDYYVADLSTDVITENANEGVDTIQVAFTYTLGANLENLVLAAGAAINGTGNAFNNVITGNALSNVIDGGVGADTLLGGAGDDTYLIDSSVDVVTESANEGIDTVQASFSYSLSANLENLTLTGTSAVNGSGNALNNVLTGNSAANVLTGGAGDDTYVVGASDTVVEYANEGADVVQSSVTYTLGVNLESLALTGTTAINGTGNALDNVLTGNSAANVLSGGLGNDTYVIGSGDTVVENGNEGVDTVQSTVTATLSSYVENLTLIGSSAINATGNGLDNVLTGNSAVNVLTGGAGNDTYVVGAGDSVVEGVNAGLDTVLSSASFTLGVNVENLTLAGSSAINGTGNALNNALLGNSGNNVLDGGTGQDVMTGGAGDDTYVVNDVGDMVLENANEGNDTVQATVSFTAGGNIENVTLLGTAGINATGDASNNLLMGNSAANVLAGGGGNDTLNGNGGADTLVGGAGDDTYLLAGTGATIVENASEGIDTVQAAFTHVLDSNVDNLTLTGTASINGTGNSLANVITGNSGNNLFDGGGGADTVYGGDGADTLVGGSDDRLYGGAGNDLYILDGLSDTLYLASLGAPVSEVDGSGIDTIQTNYGVWLFDYYYYQNGYGYRYVGSVENVTLTGVWNVQLRGTDSDNVLIGNAGDNFIFGASGNDTLDGGAGNDELYGDRGSDTLRGGDGNDLLDGGGFAGETDQLFGGAGDDTYVAWQGSIVTENPNDGIDTIEAYSSGYTLGANLENLRLYVQGTATGNSLGNVLTAYSGNNSLYGLAGNDTLDGGEGGDTLVGGVGDDTYLVDNTGDLVTESIGEGTDTVQAAIAITLGANVENLTLTGAAAINGTGSALNNVLTGNSANNVLTGGLGNDTYVITSGDTIVENAGEGTDVVQVGFSYGLGGNLESLTLIGSAAVNGTGNAVANVLTGNVGNNVLDGGAAADTMSGGLGNDTYVVDNASDVVIENVSEGTDTVQSSVTYSLAANVENLTLTGSQVINGSGNSSANTLTGNAAANFLAGGLGDDTYVMGDALDTIAESANEGIDTVQSSITYTLGANLENLVLTGSAAINGYGNALANTLTGNGGANALAGGLGDDTYILSDYADTIVENVNEGVDIVKSSFSYTLSANVENLVLTGSANAGTGNSLANTITGNIYGNLLDGASGADTMIGGKADDTYLVDNVGDVVNESASEGLDTVQSSVSFTLAANVENLALTGAAAINGFGNALNNTLTGNSAINTLAGGSGDDIYVIGTGDVVSEGVNEGIDTVRIDSTYTLGANVDNLVLTGYEAIDGTGNSLDNVLTGNSAANVLTGGAGNDTYVVSTGSDTVVELASHGIDTVRSHVTYTLGADVENLTLIDLSSAINGTGNILDNVLTGNTYANVLTGGAGNDTYVIAAGDAVVEAINEGTDTVMVSVTYALTENVENATLAGTAAIDATGNSLDNVLTGNVANNTLDGQLGADHMTGGAGNDTYWVENVGDVVIENANEGVDTVQSFVDYTLGANLENLSLNSVQAVTATGNELNNAIAGTTADNALIGLGGDDSLDGRMGADTMIGGVGNDTYSVDSLDDLVVEVAGEGTDTIQSAIDYVLGANVENLTLLGIAAVHGTGNGGNNILIGGVGDSVLDGGAGADTMSGGRGNDAYVVDNLGDSVTENANEGSDSVFSSVSFTLAADVENLTLTGSDAINGVGNASDNTLTGNGASNTLSASSGNNYVDGGAGADLLSAGGGNDIYVVDDLGDVVQDTGGYDTVRSSVSFALGSSLENLTLTGSSSVDGAGNVNANILIGNASANVLDGGASADTMLAGAGDDTYIVDDVGDWVGEYAGEGIDTVRSSVTSALSVNVENLELTGNGAINGTDNVLDNTLLGNAGNNKLSAGSGNDTVIGAGGADTLADSVGDNVLIGGAGNDVLQGGTGADVFAFNRGDGADTLASAGGGLDTLAIGGGIGYADMTFGKAGNDLLFGLSAGEQIVLKDWYANAGQRSVTNLQVIAQAMSDFSPGGSDPLRDNKIEEFDFAGLVGRFDQVRAVDPLITSWALSGALSEFHMSGSDTTAIGGDVVLGYGIDGQIPVIGGTSALAPAALVSASEGSSELAGSVDDLMAGSVETLFASSADTAQLWVADPAGGATNSLLTEHRLDPSMAMPADDAAAWAGMAEDGTPRPSVDVGADGAANAPAGGITRGSSATSASSSSGHGVSAGQGSLGMDAGTAANGAGASTWGRPDISWSEPGAKSSNDALSERIDRVLDQWNRAKDTSPSIRLSHYDEVLRGESAASEGARSGAGIDLSYTSRWQRLRFLLDQHVSTFGDVAASDLGPQLWSPHAMSGALGDGPNAESKFGARRASARTPLPMFSGLQDGFDRL